ncbi:MAG TPA: lanthionine synthetase LanC family protein [Kofleriaceae bacterium]|jgi:hypothetical protein|nr:lanthionine synthetase LanC family protein [Kofleriaceae bacterium]
MMISASQGHLPKTDLVYAHGFLGAAAMEAYLQLARHRLGLIAQAPALPSDPPSTFCSAWGGFGAQLILSQLATGTVSDRLWRRFSRALAHTNDADFYRGLEGALPVLAVLEPARGERAVRLARLAHQRVTQRLTRSLDRHDRGAAVPVGFGHGVAGALLAYEIGCALLRKDGTALRHRTIAHLADWAIATTAGALWPETSRSSSSPHVHGICHGAPGICLAALLGYRYSGDAAYAPLVEQAITTVPVRTPLESLCCGTLGRVEVLIEAYRTTQDDQFLALARQVFAQIDVSQLSGASWQNGDLAYRFTVLRLSAPREVDLPGLPMAIHPFAPAPRGSGAPVRTGRRARARTPGRSGRGHPGPPPPSAASARRRRPGGVR